jgi:nicotinic acid phosphoribosyltransferase
MKTASIAKVVIDLQKQSLDNFFDAWIISQDLAEKTARVWAKQMGINEKIHEFGDRWRTIIDQERDDTRKRLHEGLKSMENYFIGLEHKKPSENLSSHPAE